MLGQLITMVGHTNSEQQNLKKQMESIAGPMDGLEGRMDSVREQMNNRFDIMESQLSRLADSIQFLVHKTGEHNKNFYILKHKQFAR